jgi:hypothetical protein
MIKSFYVFFLILSLCLAGIYIFVPQKIVVSKVEEVESSERIVSGHLNDNHKRRKWWPSKIVETMTSDTTVLNYEGYSFRFIQPDFNSSSILISDNNSSIPSVFTWAPSRKNFIEINWTASFQTSYNPIKRVIQYVQAHRLKTRMTAITESLLRFIVKSENVYGISIQRSTIKDTLLAATTITGNRYPGNEEIYDRIESMIGYIESQKAKPANPPMLNISQNEQGAYQTTIGIPISKLINPGGGILINRMVAGNTLISEIKGGPRTIAKAFDQMELYLEDFKLVSPAMPFESLVTDRRAEPDTSNWVTKIYYPIF